MPRLFWRLFLITWLTMTVSTVVGITLAPIIGSPPAHIERSLSHARILSRSLAEMTRTQGLSATKRFLLDLVKAKDNAALTIDIVSPAADCVASPGEIASLLLSDGVCYKVVVNRPDPATSAIDWPGVMPWLTAVAAGLLSSLVLASSLLKPVERLRRGLRALAEGRFETRIHNPKARLGDEIASLTRDFDVSAARLQALHANRQRLFHDISHELRSPLSRLQAVTGILRKNPTRLSSLMDRIDREVVRLDQLVGEVLTLARLSSGDHRLEDRQVLDLIDLIDDIVQDAAFEAEAKQVILAFRRQGSFVASVDGELLYRAIENIIRNAVKYTRPETTVRVETQISPQLLTLRVSDQGTGVGEAELERIFEPFTTVADRHSAAGYGLGLAISKSAIERHGGTITAGNIKGAGLCVTVSLPSQSP